MDFPLLPLWNGLTGVLDAMVGKSLSAHHREERPQLPIEYDAGERRKGGMIARLPSQGPAVSGLWVGRSCRQVK